MFIWNKDKTFCIKYEDIEGFEIKKIKANVYHDDDVYEILAFLYKKQNPCLMGDFYTKEEAIKSINEFIKIIRRRE